MVRRTAAIVLLTLLLGSDAGGMPVDVRNPPPDLPRYDLSLTIDVARHQARLTQRCTWTNLADRPTSRVVFNVYPNFRVPDKDIGSLAKTLELLRLNPRDGMDLKGHRGKVCSVKLLEPGTEPVGLAFRFRADNMTALEVPLPRNVRRGESVELELEYVLDLPPKQGRWGQWPVDTETGEFTCETVTQLSSWMPMFAYYSEAGWYPTPFVPWHQPFMNEAGLFTARIRLPTCQTLACTARTLTEQDFGNGWKVIETEPIIARDFSLMCSARYQQHVAKLTSHDGREIEVVCYAFSEHSFYGREMARIAAEAIETYSRWMGPYPYPRFSIAETYFGWNGNECSGLIMIDQRVFGMPHLALGYVEYLVSHETCHQWFYNVIGTNGYAETFIDEGFATYLTHRWMDRKLGKNNDMLQWPDRLNWLPNISRENYRWGSYYGTIGRGKSMPAAAPLPEYGNLFNLFGAAYDRGSKIMGMIEERLGEAAFIEFLRMLYRKYYFRILTAKDLQRELEEFTGRDWEEFFQQWVYGAGLSDWKVADVDLKKGPHGDVRTFVHLKQKGEISEQTMLGVSFEKGDGYPLRIPIVPGTGPLIIDEPPVIVRPLPTGDMEVEMQLGAKPVQIAIDPDQVLADANPANNYWKPRLNVRFAPFYTGLEETDLTSDYDKWNLTYGPALMAGTEINGDPWYSQPIIIGGRVGLYRTQKFRTGVFAGYRTDFRDFVVGADGLLDHWPGPNLQLGYQIEQRVGEPIGQAASETARRATVFGRYVMTPATSLYLPPLQYIETFATYQDNFLPFARITTPEARRPEQFVTGGVHYRIDYRTPYWHPEAGFRFDVSYAGGAVNLDEWRDYHAMRGEFSLTKRLPFEFGYLADVVFAGRIGGAVALPDEGQFFALGGGYVFRGFDFAERQGSMMWYSSMEGRFPIVRDLDWDALDHVAGLRNLYVAGFYDIGNIYVGGDRLGETAHALGVGIRFDLAWFGVIERSTFRVDAAKSINTSSPWQFWFGIQHPF